MAAKNKVVLVSMPWASIFEPSLALGILAAICNEEQIPVTTLYPNLDMGASIGILSAEKMATNRLLFGFADHLFACDLFGSKVLNSDHFLESSLQNAPAGWEPFNDAAFVKRLRDVIVPEFLDKIQDRVLRENPTVVGFTATFNQTLASLALARRLKQARPGLQILAGGACFDGEMGREYHRALPNILDHVFMGEAEESFREYLRRHVAGESTRGIPGVTDYDSGKVFLIPGKPLANMNESPMPDYDGYFLELERLRQETNSEFCNSNDIILAFCSSRGCWWGQKNHCVFCGLNDDLIRFREKDADRVVSEITALSAKYSGLNLLATDWIISRKSRKAIFETLSRLKVDIEIFYETRSDMSKEEVASMRDSGVVRVQPGIESFSTELLMLMGKGTSRIRQVQFLRWCKEYKINSMYNLLCGFPNDKVEWYLEMAEFLPQIFHLQPPVGTLSEIEMHRFSPIFERRDEFGVTEWQIREDYCCNFPPELLDLKKVGYFFTYKSSKIAPKEKYVDSVRRVVDKWLESYAAKPQPAYIYAIGPGFLSLVDARTSEITCFNLDGIYKDIVLLADKIQSVSSLKKLLAPLYPIQEPGNTVEEAVEELVQENVLMREGELILTLPIAKKPRTTEELYSLVLGSSPVSGKDGLPTAAVAA